MRHLLKSCLFGLSMITIVGVASAEVECKERENSPIWTEGNWTVCVADTGQGSVNIVRGNTAPQDKALSAPQAADPQVVVQTLNVINQQNFVRPTRLDYTTLRAFWRGSPDRLRCTRFVCRSANWR
ncbi:MAG: hypothetical protein AAFX02_01135 [Pseudomonadota bacterium]